MSTKSNYSMKSVFVCLLSLLLLAGCGNDSAPWAEEPEQPEQPEQPEVPNPEQPDREVLPFSLKADVTDVHLLEMMKLAIVFDGTMSVGIVREYYDKLEWVVADEDGKESTLSLLDENGFLLSWGHCFYYPGTFTSYLRGSMKGEVTYQSQALTLNVSADRDFLGWNWNELPDNTDVANGYVNVLNPDFELCSVTLAQEGKRGIYIFPFNAKAEEENSFCKRSSEKLYRYMTDLYGEPVVDKEGADLDETYRTEFVHCLSDAKPLAIWKTESSRMVLLEVPVEDWKIARVFAEPLLPKE